MDEIPAKCPECGGTNPIVNKVPPGEHEQGDRWLTRVACRICDEYTDWFG